MMTSEWHCLLCNVVPVCTSTRVKPNHNNQQHFYCAHLVLYVAGMRQDGKFCDTYVRRWSVVQQLLGVSPPGHLQPLVTLPGYLRCER
jgi:hypothetical protein